MFITQIEGCGLKEHHLESYMYEASGKFTNQQVLAMIIKML